jgi:hypothetical protein
MSFGTLYRGLMILVPLGLAAVFSTSPASAQAGRMLPDCPRDRSSDDWDRCVGVWRAPEGDILYSGEFDDGVFHGYGVLIVDGSRYSGQFRQGRMHGEGVLVFEDGQMYIGGFEQGVISGFGRLVNADGSERFNGRFVDGVPQQQDPQQMAPQPQPAAQPAEQANAAFRVGDAVDVMSNGWWYPARIKAVNGPGLWLIGYDNYGASWDEVVGPERIRVRGADANDVRAQGTDPTTAPTGNAQAGSIDAGGTGAWPTPPSGAMTPIEGVYLTVRTSMFGSSISTTTEAWFFTRNGRFSRQPKGGVTLDALARRAEPGEGDGSYWVQDGQLVLAWADGREPWQSEYSGEPQSLTIGTSFASKWSGFPKGWRFDGGYEGGASIGGGALSSSNTLIFKSDGTFSREGIVNVSSQGRSSAVSGGATGGAAGTYEFDQFSLTLRENGVEQSFTVFGWGERDAAGRPERLFWEGLMMDRLNR